MSKFINDYQIFQIETNKPKQELPSTFFFSLQVYFPLFKNNLDLIKSDVLTHSGCIIYWQILNKIMI